LIKKIIVLGGAGYIGSVLTEILLKKKFFVISIDSLKFGKKPILKFLKNKNFKFYKLNTSNYKKIGEISNQSFAVVDLSGIVGDPACSINRKNTLNSNYYNTKKIIDELKGKNIKKFIYASSCSVYGSSVGKQLINEKSKVKPISLYAELKIKCEKYILSSRNLDYSPTILRLATVFGYSFRQRFDLVINLFTLFSFMGKKIQVFGGEQYRPNVHVYDVAIAILKCINAKKKLVHKQIFNVGSNHQNKKVKDIAKIIAKNKKNTKIEIKKSMIDLRDYHIDFSKIKSRLAFSTKFSISSGSKDLFNKLKKNKILRKNLRKFSNYKVEAKKYAKKIQYKKKLK
tara:strand:+ start:224 stop:1249 length:1026 start_codon:yes stop_codon:yes gene_type:complete